MNPRKLAEKWRKQNPGMDHGYVIIYAGKVAGWTSELSDTRARDWKWGCVAVPQFRNSPMFTAAGADGCGWGGAGYWARIEAAPEIVCE